MKVFVFILLLILSFSDEWIQKERIHKSHSRVVNETSCPPENEITKQLLMTLLTGDDKHQLKQRQELQIQRVQPDAVTLLTDENDKEVCRKISTNFPRKKDRESLIRTYYKTDQYYYVVNYSPEQTTDNKPEYGIQFSGHLIVILDKEFNNQGAAVMHTEE